MRLLKKGIKFKFSLAVKGTFKYLKLVFIKELVSREFNLALVFFLKTNTFAVAVLGILSQRNLATSPLHPIIYYSKKLTPAKVNYTT